MTPKPVLFYINATTSFSLYYLNPDPTDPKGFGRGSEYHTEQSDSAIATNKSDTPALRMRIRAR
jgi:hypothetical protein